MCRAGLRTRRGSLAFIFRFELQVFGLPDKEAHLEKRVLVVENEPGLRELIKSVLSANGMNVLALTNSVEAAACVTEERFDVIFLSLDVLPDGMDLARHVREKGSNRTTPIIMMSGDQDLKALTRGFEAGANFFLYKPIDRKQLVRLMHAAQGTIEHERRRFRRIPLHSKVLLKFEKREIECETIDISLNGMLVSAPVTFPAGSSAELCLQLSPTAKPIVGSGLVMRTIEGNQMGIRFVKMSTLDMESLQEFLLPFIGSDSRLVA